MKSLIREFLFRKRLEVAKRWQERWLTLPGEQIKTKQLKNLRERWREATEHIPYYRNLVARGDAPATLESIAMFRQTVPILTRETLIAQRDQFQRDIPPHHELMTAGSTGNPLRFGNWKDEAIAHTGVNQWVGRLHNGMAPDDKVFMLWGHSHLLGTGIQGRLKNLKRKTQDWLLGYRRVDAYHVEPARAIAYLDDLRRFRPRIVIGYACALDMMARHNLNAGRSADDLGIKLCIACAEMFPQPDSREVLQRFFGSPVVMEYGGVDFGVCAYERVDTTGYRVFWWSHLLEVEGDSAEGPLLVTNLTERYLPLFRYRNGDACERANVDTSGVLQGFAAIKGRVNDTLEMPDGRVIHSVGLFHCIHQESVWSIQLAVGDDGMRLRLATDKMTEAMESRIRSRLGDLHPALADCPIDVVTDVATNRAGKRRWIVDERS
ncbi:MAG: hypothetical protein JXR84_22920 [Anaerolineae bacterium]|nr:hypothetical protein [Anaerolineae bacterium]